MSLSKKYDDKLRYLREKRDFGELKPDVALRLKRLEDSGALNKLIYASATRKIIDQLYRLEKLALLENTEVTQQENVSTFTNVSDKTKKALDYVSVNIETKFSKLKFDADYLKSREEIIENTTLKDEFVIGLDEDGNEVKATLADMTLPDGEYTINDIVTKLRATISENNGKLANRLMAKGMSLNDAYMKVNGIRFSAQRILDELQWLTNEYVVSATMMAPEYQEKIGFEANPVLSRLIEETKESIDNFMKTPQGDNLKEEAVNKGILDASGNLVEGKLGEWLSLNKKRGQDACVVVEQKTIKEPTLEEVVDATHAALVYVRTNLSNKFPKVKFDKEFLDKIHGKIAGTPIEGEFVIEVDNDGNEITATLDDLTVQNGKYYIYETVERLNRIVEEDNEVLTAKLMKEGLSVDEAALKCQELKSKTQMTLDFLDGIINSFLVGMVEKDIAYQQLFGYEANPAFNRIVHEAIEKIQLFATTEEGQRLLESCNNSKVSILDEKGIVRDGMLGEFFYAICKEGQKMQTVQQMEQTDEHVR